MLNKKTILGVAAVSLSVLLSSQVMALQPGMYVGGQVGVGSVNQDKLTETNFNLPKNSTFQSFTSSTGKANGLAGRLFAGYQFNENFAAELGWTKFSDVESKFSGKLKPASTLMQPVGMQKLIIPGTVQGKQTLKTDAIDLVAKGIVPVTDKVSVYAKGGAAYVISRTSTSTSGTELGKKVTVKSNNKNKLMPTVGVGASYAFSPSLAADMEVNRIQKIGNGSNFKSANYLGVGLTYSIG